MQQERAVILIKAAPHPSRKYQETVCCAGITPERQWRRLYPIRYRHLQGSAQFNRWDILEYRGRRASNDSRPETRHVEEPSLSIAGSMKRSSRADFLGPIIRRSARDAAERGESLAIVRPTGLKFRAKVKRAADISIQQAKIAEYAKQASFLDAPLQEREPLSHTFGLTFSDDAGKHVMVCGDWETAATFWKWRLEYGETSTIERLRQVYEDRYAHEGVVLALGTVAKRPRQWLLLGVIRLDESSQQLLI